MLTTLPWGVKAFALATLSRVPLGKQTYRILQEVAGSTRLRVDTYYQQRTQGLRSLLDAGYEIEGKDVLEIGTGWHPLVPILYYLLGARRIVTVDTNPWLKPGSLHETLIKTLSIQGKIEEDFSSNCSGMHERFAAIRSLIASPPTNLEESCQQLLSLDFKARPILSCRSDSEPIKHIC